MNANLETIKMIVRVGFGQSWQLANQVQDIAERVGVRLVGGSPEQGQAFFECAGTKIGQFKLACQQAGFIATIQ